MNIKYLKKKEPFWGASRIFKWSYSCPALAIDKKLLEDSTIDVFGIKVGMEVGFNFITRTKAVEIVNKNNSWYKMKGNKMAGCIPTKEFSRELDIATGHQPNLFSKVETLENKS